MIQKKVAFIEFWNGFQPQDFILYRLLAKHYDLVLTDPKDADYVFYSVWGDSHWFVPDHCVKIFFTGENRTPDFNACDYAIGFERLTFNDRYFRLPLYYVYPECSLMELKHLDINRDTIQQQKTGFCSFTVSNGGCMPRNDVFKALSAYKKVDSGGRFLNNIGGPIADKFAFDCSHKFTICYENFSYNGYCTEKIAQAFAARTIPIYWGDPKVAETFNKNAFINVHDFDSLEAVVDRVREIDNNDELWFEMLEQPAFLSEEYTLEGQTRRLEAFLLNIFDQPLEETQRRTRYAKGAIAPQQRELLNTYYYSKLSMMAKLRHTLKKLVK